MSNTERDLFADIIDDLNTLTTIAQANVITKDVKALALGETRPNAILFLDIVNFSELTKKLPSERLTMLIDRIFQIFELTVKAYGGYCNKVIGDAGLYVFPGHPAHPPAIEGALRAGLGILERAAQLKFSLEPYCINFNIRIGVAFGVVTRERVGSKEAQFTVMGNTVNLAKRLEASAAPATMQVLPETAEAVGDMFTFESVGEKELKNIGTFAVLKVVKLTEKIYQLRSSGTYLAQFIGRETEFAETVKVINNWLKTSYSAETFDVTKMTKRLEKHNRLFVIRGAMALGKSRMAYELLQHYIREHKANVATAHCLTNNMLDMFGAELVRVAGITAENLPERWEELCAHAETTVSREYADRQRKHLPLLAMLLDCPRINTEMIRKIDAQSFVLAVQLAFCGACELIAHFTQRPVIVIIEDVQWLSSYEDLLANILNSASLPQPLIIIATARPEYEYNAELFDGVCEYHEISITPIGSADGRALVNSILPGIDLSADSWIQIVEKAAGIPYYYEEFARLLVRRGYVENQNGKFKLIRELTEIELPADIQMLILGKLDQLEPKLKLLVSKASVLGCAFMAKLLIEIEGKLSNGEPEKIPEMLLQLVSEEIFARGSNTSVDGIMPSSYDKDRVQEVKSVDGIMPSNNNINRVQDAHDTSVEDDKYFFRHIVTQESAYKAMLERNKVLLHTLAVEVLESLIVTGSKEEKELLPELIFHLVFLNRFLDAHKSCCILLTLFANTGQYKDWDEWEVKAERLWFTALEHDAELPNQSPYYLIAVSARNRRKGKYAEAIKQLKYALELVVSLKDVKTEAYAIMRIGVVHKEQGRYKLAMKHYEQSLAIRRKINDRRGEANTMHNIGVVHNDQGLHELAMQFYEQSLDIKRELGDQQGEANTLNNIGLVYYSQGQYELAMQFYKQSLEIKRELGDRQGEASTLLNIGIVHNSQRHCELAMKFYEQSLAIKREINDRWAEGSILNNIGDVHRAQGLYEQAIQFYEQSLAIKRELGNRPSESCTLESLTQLMILMKDFFKAKEYCIAGEKIAEEVKDRKNLGYFAADWSMIYAAEGDIKKAHDYLLKAKDIILGLNSNMGSDLGQTIAKAEAALQAAMEN